jgi:hypothetical protein
VGCLSFVFLLAFIRSHMIYNIGLMHWACI